VTDAPAFAKMLVQELERVGLRAKAWSSPDGRLVRVYVGEQHLSVGADGSISTRTRGRATFLPSGLYPGQRRAFTEAMRAYGERAREALERRDAEAARAWSREDDWVDVTDAFPLRPAGVFRAIAAALEEGDREAARENLLDLLDTRTGLPPVLQRIAVRRMPFQMRLGMREGKVERVLLRRDHRA